MPAPALAQTTNWTGATDDDWFDASNWDNGVPAPVGEAVIATGVGVPSVIDGGTVDTGQITLGGVDVGVLTVTNGATLTTDQGALVGEQAGAGTSSMTVTGGSSWTGFEVEVGRNGAGQLEVLDGSTVVLSDALDVGLLSSTGEVLVDGAGTSLTAANVEVGQGLNSTGTLTVSGGGRLELANPATSQFYIGIGVNSQATVLLTGAGTSLVGGTAGAALSRVSVGSGGGLGRMTAEAGASASVYNLVIGRQTGSNGIMAVTGAGTIWENANTAVVGNLGTGRLTVADGARMTAVNGTVVASGAASTGTLELDGTAGARGVLETSQVSAGNGVPKVEFDGGVLRITGNQATLFNGFAAGEVEFLAGGAFIDTQGFFGGIDVNLEGAGRLTKQGSGALGLRGTNTFAGGLHVEGGSVTFTSADNLGAVAGGIMLDGGLLHHTSAGNVDVDHDIVLGAGGGTFESDPGSLDLTGDISGAGGLTIDTTGNVSLSGTNTYGGATNIVAGMLQGEGGSAIPDTSGVSVAAGAKFQLHGDETIGSLAGAGAVQPDVADSTLTLGADGTSSAVFSGVLQDNVVILNLAKTGAGAQTLSGTNTYTGATTVSGGTLAVNGSIATSSGVTVGSGGFLGGIGTVAPVTVQSGGTLAPGNSIGTITVNGSLSFAAGSTYAVEVSPAGADRTNVAAVGGAGTASLTGATVAATYAAGGYISKRYTILNAAGGLGGTTFAGLTGTAPAGTSHALAYDGNNAYLDLTLLMAGSGTDDGDADDGDSGDTGGGSSGGDGLNPFNNLSANQQSVADAIVHRFNTSGGIPAAFAGLDPAGLTAVSGETGAAGQQAGILATDHFLDAIAEPALGDGQAEGRDAAPAAYNGVQPASPAAERFARFSYGAEELGGGTDPATRALRLQHRVDAGFADPTRRVERYSVWGAALGGGISLSGDPVIGSQALSGSVYGVASGFDWLNGGTRAGFALGASWSNAAVAGLGAISTGNASAGVRASHDFGRLYLAGAAAYGLHFGSTTRAVFGETYTAAYVAQSFSARAEAGWRFKTRAVDIVPFAAARVISLSTPAYAETGSGAGTFALAYNAASALEVRSELGLRLNRTVMHASGGSTSFSGMLGWAHHFARGGTASAGFAALPGTAFVTQGARGASDTALVSLGVSHRFASGLGLSLGADGEFGAGTIGYSAKAQLKLRW